MHRLPPIEVKPVQSYDFIQQQTIRGLLLRDEAFMIARAVLEQAIEDLDLPLKNKNCSCRWFISNEMRPYSYIWLCQHLKVNPERLRKKYFGKIYKEFV